MKFVPFCNFILYSSYATLYQTQKGATVHNHPLNSIENVEGFGQLTQVFKLDSHVIKTESLVVSVAVFKGTLSI